MRRFLRCWNKLGNFRRQLCEGFELLGVKFRSFVFLWGFIRIFIFISSVYWFFLGLLGPYHVFSILLYFLSIFNFPKFR